MERLDGFSFDDVDGMHAAGIDTEKVVRALTIAFLEGATLHGVFHGDLHGGNLLVQGDGRVALLDYGITGRLDQDRRLAFLRMLMGGSLNDPGMQITALRDLGALPPDTDIDAVVHDLGLDQPAKDPTAMAPEDLLKEVRDITKRLLEYGARFPKVLMLFVKDMLFIDGALATMAPDVDLFSEVMQIAAYFTANHGEQIASDIGIDPRANPVDMDGVRAAVGVPSDVEKLSYRDLQARRELIRKRMDDHRRSAPRPGPRATLQRLRHRD
jgi:ubiquinone biosynthesis protein